MSSSAVMNGNHANMNGHHEKTNGSTSIMEQEEDEKDILLLLRGINSNDVSEALLYIRRVYELLNHDSVQVKRAHATKIVNLQGLSIIVFSMETHKYSTEFISRAVGCLVKISFFLPEMNKLIVDLNAFNILRDTSINETVDLNANVMGLLLNMSHSDKAIAEVATEEIIDFGIDVMKQFPDDSSLQVRGCRYLHNIMILPGKKEELKNKKIATLLAKTYDDFLDKDEEAHQAAKAALECFFERK